MALAAITAVSGTVLPSLSDQLRADVELHDMFLVAERTGRGSDQPNFVLENGVLKRIVD